MVTRPFRLAALDIGSLTVRLADQVMDGRI